MLFEAIVQAFGQIVVFKQIMQDSGEYDLPPGAFFYAVWYALDWLIPPNPKDS